MEGKFSSKMAVASISSVAKAHRSHKHNSNQSLKIVAPGYRKRAMMNTDKDSHDVNSCHQKRPCRRDAEFRQHEWPMFRFYPLDSHAQREFCNQLGLEYCHPNRFGRGGPDYVLTYPNIATVRSIIGDGNCLFRAFSKILTGSQDPYRAIRERIVTHMHTIAPYLLGSHITEYNSIQSYIEQQMDQNRAWGSEVEMLTLAHLINTNIYSIDTTTQRWWCYSPHYVDRTIPLDVSKKSLYIIHYPWHFAVVSSVEQHVMS